MSGTWCSTVFPRFGTVPVAGVAMALLLSAAGNLFAQAYPVRPVRVVVNYTPGGTTDVVARALSQKLAEATGQPVTVENRPSANGVLGTQDVARSRPDGYNLLFSTSGHTVLARALLGEKLPFDPLRDLTPVCLAVVNTQIIVAPVSLGVKNIPELVKLMKAGSGQYSFASVGLGTPNHLGIELLKHMGGFDMLHVPYKGGQQAVLDLVTGRVHLMLASMVSFMPYVKAGKLAALGVGSARRSAAVPDVPTVMEQGYPDFEVFTWYGMFGPAGLPREVTLRLNTIFNEALKNPEIIRSFTSQGAEPAGGSPEELARIMRSEYERWRKVVTTARIEAE